MKYFIFALLLLNNLGNNDSYYVYKDQNKVGVVFLKLDTINNVFYYYGKAGISTAESYGDIVKKTNNEYYLSSYSEFPATCISKKNIKMKYNKITVYNDDEALKCITKMGLIINGKDYPFKNEMYKAKFSKTIILKGFINQLSLYCILRNNDTLYSKVFVNCDSSNSFKIVPKFENELYFFGKLQNEVLRFISHKDTLRMCGIEDTLTFIKMDIDSIYKKYYLRFDTSFMNTNNLFLKKSDMQFPK